MGTGLTDIRDVLGAIRSTSGAMREWIDRYPTRTARCEALAADTALARAARDEARLLNELAAEVATLVEKDIAIGSVLIPK